jgi:DNA-binding transcriptional regulator LsrR (DeoR family)
MYKVDGMKEQEIAKATGLTLLEVNSILDKYESGEVDYSEEDDGQPTMYEEYQDYMGGDDWDHGQYDGD